MALPILEISKYEMKLASGEPITFRPFLVKEQKVLLTALQTGNRSDAIRAMMEVVSVCTFNKLDLTKVPTMEAERVFLNIRAKSVGEELNISIKCEECETPNPYVVKLLDDMKTVVEYKKPEPVKLTENYGLIFSYPTMMDMLAVIDVSTADTLTFYFELGKKCLQGVYQGSDYFTATDSSVEEKNAVFNRLEPEQFKRVQEFFDNAPSINYELKFTCTKCQHENDITIEGTDSFFG